MEKSKFVYVVYIRSTPEKVWQALTQPEFTRQFFSGTWQECAWTKGASWKLIIPDGQVIDSGEVLEIDPPRKLVLSWRKEMKSDMQDEPASRMTYQIDLNEDGLVKLTVIHASEMPESKLIQAVSNGWPIILSSLKSLLETGKPLEGTSTW